MRTDHWHLNGRSFAEFMNAEVREADRILILLSPAYRTKVHAMEAGGAVRGTGWESMLLTSALCANLRSRETIHCGLLAGDWGNAAPSWLSGLQYYDLRSRTSVRVDYPDLLQDLMGVSAIPPVGKRGAETSDSGAEPSSDTPNAVIVDEEVTELRITLKPGVEPSEFLPRLADLADLTGKIDIVTKKPRRRP